MYEIWLMLNIVWEMAVDLWPLLLLLAVLWLALLAGTWRRAGTHWRAALPLALGVFAATALVAALLLPGWTRSTLSEMGYWVDWAMLLGLAAAAGALAGGFVWPMVAAWRHGRAA